jgi:hypothetical protein
MHKQRVVMIALSAIGALGTFLPWVNIPIIGSINGTAGADGWITTGLFAATIVATLVVRDRVRPLRVRDGLLVSAPAVLAALVGGYKIFDFYSTMNSLPGDNPFAKGLASTVSVGPGLFAIVLMGLGVPGVAVAMERGASPQAANPIPSKPLPRSVFTIAIVGIAKLARVPV